MSRYRGIGNNRGSALGLALILKQGENPLEQSPRILEHVAQTSRSGGGIRLDIVLVGSRLEDLQLVSIPYTRIVGYAAETPSVLAANSHAPVVIADIGPLGSIPTDSVVLIDSDSGSIAFEPDPTEIALLQAQTERLAPRTRISLEAEHLPARTIDGRYVQVVGEADSEEGAVEAARCGADAILLRCAAGIFPSQDSDEEQIAILTGISRSTGKPLLLSGDSYSVSISALLQSATAADITLLLPMDSSGFQISQVLSYLTEVSAELRAEDLRVDRVGLGISAELGAGSIGAPDLDDISRMWIVCSSPDDLSSDANIQWLEEAIQAASAAQVPVLVNLSTSDENEIRATIGIGATGLIVEANHVQQVKEIVRTLSFEDCRDGSAESET